VEVSAIFSRPVSWRILGASSVTKTGDKKWEVHVFSPTKMMDFMMISWVSGGSDLIHCNGNAGMVWWVENGI